ncbi:protein disulfide-isomerase [Cololabis saira]|uniref:protein disulfide-isomerase n=1 Tax=Cololabis saira TaxID=129043 RepID=UPI002AD519A2|nr:protein disulfide-isomerase [Cololabis saira]
MRSSILVALTTFCLCLSVAADAQSDRDEKKTFPEEDGLLQLEKKNFNRALRKYKQLLVHFYSPLTGEAHRVAAVFKDAAAVLQESEVKLAVVDVTEEKDLAKSLNATDPPTIRLYLSGDLHNPVPCPVPQSSSSILTWLKRRVGSAADLITDLSQSEASDELTVVGFFKELDNEYVQLFYEAAINLPDVSFAVTQNDEVISKYGVTHNVVLLLKKSKLLYSYKMMPDTCKEELMTLISVYQMDLVTEYDGQTANRILSSPVLNHALLFINRSSADFQEILSAFTGAAESFRMKILFVLVNVDESRNGRVMEYFRVRDFEAPLIRMVNLTDHVTYHLPSETLDTETIKEFCHSFLEGTAKPKMQTLPIPEGWDKEPVKELVGMNLEEVAFNPNKTVFVLFYLPYSKKSHAVFPLWEEVAEAFKEQEDVVVAQIDASANDINMSMQGAYPSLCLFPALYAERVVVYTGKRKLKDLVRFVEKEMEKAKEYRVKENEDRRKYAEAVKAEGEQNEDKTKDEL